MLKLFVAAQNAWYSLREEEGQTMAEYGVVLAVITIGVVTVLGLLSLGIQGSLNKVIGILPK
jgi:Flp pilus assembly pilin Flp